MANDKVSIMKGVWGPTEAFWGGGSKRVCPSRHIPGQEIKENTARKNRGEKKAPEKGGGQSKK